MIDLSIIIPHYNTPQLLKKLLDTIPNLDNIQVIVIDDNSTASVEYYEKLCADYSYVTFLRNHTGKNSCGTCRNIGLRHAIGKWILFADADDYFADNFYEEVSKFFESNYDAIFFPPTSIDIDTGIMSNRHIHYEKLIINYLKDNSYKNTLRLKYCFITACSRLILRECLIKNNIFLADTFVADDMLFSVKLGHYAKNVLAVDSIIYYISLRQKSLTTVINEQNIFIALSQYVQPYMFTKQNLSKKDFRCLDISGGNFVVTALRNRYPLKLMLKIIIYLKKNKVRIFKRRYFNPIYIINELKAHSKKYEKGYYKLSKP